MDFLRDPIWQFIGVIVGFITIIVTIVLSQRQQNRKEISYQVISDAFIISIDKEVKDRVKILFDDRPVKDMSLLILRLWNSGNVAVKPEDYVEPIRCIFEGRTILGFDILSTEPSNLIEPDRKKVYLKITLEDDPLTQAPTQQFISLPKFLLNPKEAISIKVLLTGLKGQVSARARIVDGNIIEFNPMRQNQSRQTQPSNCLQRVIRVSTFWIAFYLLLTVYYKYSLNSINIFNATIVIVVGSYVFSYMILDWVTIIYKLMKKLKLI